MKLDRPTYLIAELQGDAVSLVKSMRKQFNPETVAWPVDITIAGSSGLGTIKEGQAISEVIGCLGLVINKHHFTTVNFESINRFPKTGIYYLAPQRERFDALHRAVADSGVLFNENQWVYNPHCTLRAGSAPMEECDKIFKSLAMPTNTSIACFSLYQSELGGGRRVYRF